MGLFSSIKEKVAGATVLPMVNHFIGDSYGTVSELTMTDGVLHIRGTIAGMDQEIEITIGKTTVDIARKTVTFHDITSNVIGIQNMLQKFVEGKDLDVPEIPGRDTLLAWFSRGGNTEA